MDTYSKHHILLVIDWQIFIIWRLFGCDKRMRYIHYMFDRVPCEYYTTLRCMIRCAPQVIKNIFGGHWTEAKNFN